MSKKTDYAKYLFHRGENFASYEFMGAHRGKGGEVTFRVWAPHAYRVSIVSETVGWDDGVQMKKLSSEGIFELTLEKEQAPEWMRYKYRIESAAGVHLKADPYAFHSETLEKNASVLFTSRYKMKDDKWMAERKRKAESKSFYPYPLNIYEVHLASFLTKDGASNTDGEHYLNYREIAKKLCAYVKKMGYTHIELLPITEYPYDGSWGYQVTGYYAPTSRFGTPDDFKFFVDHFHQNGIGVILDWVPAHFPKDEHGLFEFDGGPLYEYDQPARMEQPSWGTRCFDVARNEVRCFLISSAMYWLREFHIDGLRIDAVAAMLYLDYDRKPGEWTPNIYGGNINLESVEFFKRLNNTVHGEYPDVLTIAEESTAFLNVTGSVNDDGLGFSMKWNMGWANDLFRYVACDPLWRKEQHSALNFPIMYAYSEKYVLPVSHDEVVHGKKSLIDKMFGDYEMKFQGIRIFLLFQMTFPGKKLLFMGSEYGQFREWDFENQLEWFMLDYPKHQELQDYTRKLNKFYLKHPTLYEEDFRPEGFRWIYPDMANENVVAYTRFDSEGRKSHVLINFSGREHGKLILELPEEGTYKVIFTSESIPAVGKTLLGRRYKTAAKDNKIFIRLTVPALTGVIIEKTEN